jgi:hypothetical protein
VTVRSTGPERTVCSTRSSSSARVMEGAEIRREGREKVKVYAG